MRGGHLAKFPLDFKPDGHWINANEFAAQAREVKLPPVLAFEKRTKGVGHLQPSLIVDASGCVAPEHPNHSISIQKNPHDSRVEASGCQPQNIVASVIYAKCSPFNRPFGCTP